MLPCVATTASTYFPVLVVTATDKQTEIKIRTLQEVVWEGCSNKLNAGIELATSRLYVQTKISYATLCEHEVL